MNADRALQGAAYRAHYRVGEHQPARGTYDQAEVQAFAEQVRQRQADFSWRAGTHRRMMAVTYEDLTGGRQTNELSPSLARSLLGFLELEYMALTTTLLKSHVVEVAAEAQSR